MINSKLPNIETSIFAKMSIMAAEHNALNLSQGFPNFPSDPALNALVDNAMRDGFNQYAPMPGDFELRMELRKPSAALILPPEEKPPTASLSEFDWSPLVPDRALSGSPARQIHPPSL